MSAVTTIELLGYVVAAFTTTAFVPQAVQTFRTRNPEGVSLGMYSILTAGIALWVSQVARPSRDSRTSGELTEGTRFLGQVLGGQWSV